jgi:maltodextrin utilization protein YvdJ
MAEIRMILLILLVITYIAFGFFTFMLYCYFDKRYNLYVENNEESLFLVLCCIMWPILFVVLLYHLLGKDVGKIIYKMNGGDGKQSPLLMIQLPTGAEPK